MTPREIRDELKKFAREIGPRADIFAGIDRSDGAKPIFARIYPYGMSQDSALRVEVDEWADLIPALRTAWAERADEHRRATIRKMALEIIRITAEQGECTDAALRAGEFEAADVARFGPEAVADANAIASNGPFAITPAAKANAA